MRDEEQPDTDYMLTMYRTAVKRKSRQISSFPEPFSEKESLTNLTVEGQKLNSGGHTF